MLSSRRYSTFFPWEQFHGISNSTLCTQNSCKDDIYIPKYEGNPQGYNSSMAPITFQGCFLSIGIYNVFQCFSTLETMLRNTLCNFWVKKCGIHIEYTKYSTHFGTNFKYFVYSMGIPHFFTQNSHNVFLIQFPKVEKH